MNSCMYIREEVRMDGKNLTFRRSDFITRVHIFNEHIRVDVITQSDAMHISYHKSHCERKFLRAKFAL